MPGARTASIIISSYNYGRYLRDAIDSALAQTYPHTEVVVVDDASTDDSAAIISGYGSRIIPIVRRRNLGGRATYNSACQVSRGEVILFLDSDDLLAATAVERAMSFFADPDVVKVHWPLWEIDAAGERTGRRIPSGPLPDGDLRDLMVQGGPDGYQSPPATGNAYARSFLQEILPVPEGLHCDSYAATLAAATGTVRSLAEPEGCYRVHGGNGYASKPEDEKNRELLEMYGRRCQVLSQHLRKLGVEVDPDSWIADNPRFGWLRQQHLASEELKALIPPGGTFILVDDGQWGDRWGGSEILGGRRSLPFVEREGRYWGPPADDAAAIAEFERLRRKGASYIVFAWPAFWWLDYYQGLHQHLSSSSDCLLKNDRVAVFDLHRVSGAA